MTKYENSSPRIAQLIQIAKSPVWDGDVQVCQNLGIKIGLR